MNVDKKNNPIRLFIFILGFVLCISLGLAVGTNEGSNIKFIGLLLGSMGTAIGVLIAYIILRLIFRIRGERNAFGYMMGGLSLFIGLGSYIVLGLAIWGVNPQIGPRLIFYIISALIWIIIMIWGGMEPASLLALLAGAVLGGVIFPIIITSMPGLFTGMLEGIDKDPGNLQMIRILYAILGAFTGAIGASITRASGLGLREQYESEEV
ncbi:MAG: hypothetical protein K8T10_03150 [Candidatus Eremiobacteraeota bacterium]|nr:hypothetical protein [Candidatus Eremiobacteraeota bacterium]